jgi:hypothetical protein
VYECPEASGRFAAVQVIPESVSATGVEELLVEPTAMHAVDDAQKTP